MSSFANSGQIKEELISGASEEEKERDVQTLDGSIERVHKLSQKNFKNEYEKLIGEINEFKSGQMKIINILEQSK